MKNPSLRKRSSFIAILTWSKENSIVLIFLVMFFVCSLFVPRFLSFNNLINVLRQVSAFTIIAFGEFFVIVSGGFDLSVGSMIGFLGVIVAYTIKVLGVSMWLSMLLAMGVALFIGYWNGVFIVYGSVPPFIATLATMVIVKGFNFLVSNGVPISGFPETFGFIGRGYVGPIPFPIIILFFVSLVSYMFMEHTETGRSIYAVGGNEEASRLSGVNVDRIKVLVYILSALFTSIGSIMIASRIMAGQPTVGDNMLFDVITAVVLGGTSLSGGKGSIVGVICGALILGIIANVLVLLRINVYWQWIIKGMILALAVFISSKVEKRR